MVRKKKIVTFKNSQQATITSNWYKKSNTDIYCYTFKQMKEHTYNFQEKILTNGN